MTHSIRLETAEGGQVIVVAGDADSSAAPGIDEALAAACESSHPGLVVVDLTEAEFVDSRTMGVFVAWTERQRAAGGRLPIVCTNANMLRVFRQIGLDQTLELVSSRAEALGSS